VSNSEALLCAACGAQLPAAFPGASLVCTCGRRMDVLGAAPVPRNGPRTAPTSDDGSPYRSAAPSNEPVPSATCPYCGNDCPPMVRICPHCDVRLENVRCQRCFSLQAPGTFACTRCRHALELEPLLDATDAPCPRCHHPLEAAPGALGRAHECPRCGGMFVPREALAEILCSAEIGGALREGPAGEAFELGGWSADAGKPVLLDEVHYVSCPQCHNAMNRVNFGKVSGVIVDVCKAHGTWFDPGELTRVVAFAAGGGLERTRAREKLEKSDVREPRNRGGDINLQLVIMAADEERHATARLERWRDFLFEIFTF
jgi:Zn-finger nucleic acid-binding protein